jgi:hypothetical protein
VDISAFVSPALTSMDLHRYVVAGRVEELRICETVGSSIMDENSENLKVVIRLDIPSGLQMVVLVAELSGYFQVPPFLQTDTYADDVLLE